MFLVLFSTLALEQVICVSKWLFNYFSYLFNYLFTENCWYFKQITCTYNYFARAPFPAHTYTCIQLCVLLYHYSSCFFYLVQPNNFTITSSGNQFNGRTIVKTDSEVTLTVEFRADSLPIVTWFRETFDTEVETSLSNSCFYAINDLVKTEMENMFRVSTVYMHM